MRTGIVIVGRNEGSRLRLCLDSALGQGLPTIYVDSGSTDGSVALARQLRCDVHELSPDLPFSAARARNEGLEALMQANPGLALVQFLDGDSALQDDWIADGMAALDADDRLCAVCGQIQERNPQISIFNRFTAIEWYSPPGEVNSFGGICLCRIEPLLGVGGFDASLVAGEEPELSARLRAAGSRILCLDRAMAIHDAGLLRFGDWLRRCTRTGYVYAQACRRIEAGTDTLGWRPSLRVWFWSFALPAAILVALYTTPPYALIAVILYLFQTLRVAVGIHERGLNWSDALLYGLLWHVSQFAQWKGQCQYLVHLLMGRAPLVRDRTTSAMTSVFDKRVVADNDQERDI